MSDDDDMMDGVFDAMEILLSLAPVPGVAAAAIAIKEVSGYTTRRLQESSQ